MELKDYKENDVLDLNVLIENLEQREDKKGKPYLSLFVRDRSARYDAKWWNVGDKIADFQAGQVVRLQGKMTVYNEHYQIKVQKLSTVEGAAAEVELYRPVAPLSLAERKTQIYAYIEKIKTPAYHNLLVNLLEQYPEVFQYPAAKSFHHAYTGGLMVHTLSMLQVAESLGKVYPFLNMDLLYAGIFLHDFGKIWEFTSASQVQYSLAGNLEGHITLVVEAIDRYGIAQGEDMQAEAWVLLKHMVLAHHGKKEYGSPVEPQLVEAEVLHFIDHLDASLQMIEQALTQTKPGQFSERIPGLNQRQFYRPLA